LNTDFRIIFVKNLNKHLKLEMYFSIIIPVYNRPDEINELLDSLVQTDYKEDF